ncbi:MAG TPA: adenylate/guanylate cyclase domain-containing protein [Burkholderiaceae bacterium]
MAFLPLKNLRFRKNTSKLSLLLACLSIFFVLFLDFTQNSFLNAVESQTYDLRFKTMRGSIPINPDIGIIAIDDKSIAELGRFPWSRIQYVKLLDRLTEAGVKVVLFDAFFPETENAKVDKAFAAALKRAGNVVLAVSYKHDPDFKVTGETISIPELQNSAAGFAHINFFPDPDGINRRNLLVIEKDGKFVPSLGLAGAMFALGERKLEVNTFDVAFGKRQVPIDLNRLIWINFAGEPGRYPRYSFTDIVNGRIPANELKGKILFLGATALGVYDMRVTPFSGNTPGVEVHAAIADSIISQRYVSQTELEGLFDIAAIMLLGGLAFFLTTRLRLYLALPAVLLLMACDIWVDYQFFLAGHWVNMVYPSLAAIVSLMVGGSFRYLVLERNAREMRSMFSSYLSEKQVARLEKDPDAAKIGGDKKEVTVMFTDIKGFTTFSETHTSQEVVTRLNEYLSEMVQLIERFDGTVDKFIGDGIMVYWGAPLAQPDHAQLALQCVAAMMLKMKELQTQWVKEGVEPFTIRGGLQSGEVVAGNVGFRGKKMEYTVIGDTVNQAARLEGTAKFYGVSFVVGEKTYQMTRDTCKYRELDKIRVVGKQHPTIIYEPFVVASTNDEQLRERFAQGLSLYHERRWSDAKKVFDVLATDFPQDMPTQIYLERCGYFMQNPPPDDWDGVFNRTEK